MIQIQMFYSQDLLDLQKEVNLFLRKKFVKYLDFKITYIEDADRNPNKCYIIGTVVFEVTNGTNSDFFNNEIFDYD